MNNNKNMRKLKAMKTRDEKLEFMATANRVTVGEVTQIIDGDLITSFTARIRGITVAGDGEFKFNTEDEARAFGWSMLTKWKEEWRERGYLLYDAEREAARYDEENLQLSNEQLMQETLL